MPALMTRLAAVLLVALVAAARAESVPPEPVAGLEVPARIHDAGPVDRGAVVKHSFTLKNRGATELSIDAKPG
jgi:hypothetical protein